MGGFLITCWKRLWYSEKVMGQYVHCWISLDWCTITSGCEFTGELMEI